MEIEHINDDTIRVKIENNDLEERGITFLDLLGNQKQIENFFYSILEEVDIDEEFQDSEAVTFQVMPNNNGLELFISKGAQFREDFLESLEAEGVIGAEGMNQMNQEKSTQEDDVEEYMQAQETKTKEAVIVFNNIEQVILMAQDFYMESGASNLYKYKEQYYLHLVFFVEEMTHKTSDEEIAYALEFGEQSRISSDVLDEYADKIMETNALELVRHHFA
jgi:adapter protein MecA 1/2